MANKLAELLKIKKKVKPGKAQKYVERSLPEAKKEVAALEQKNYKPGQFSENAAKLYGEAETFGTKKEWAKGYDKLKELNTELVQKTIAAQLFDKSYETFGKALGKAENNYHTLMADDRPKHVYSAALKKMVTTARKHYDEYEPEPGMLALEPAAENFKEMTAKAKKDRENDLDVSRFKPVYESKLNDVNAAQKKLESMPGTQVHRKALTDAAADAKKFAGNGEYLAAADALPGNSWDSVFDEVGGNKVSDFFKRQIEAGKRTVEKVKNAVAGAGGLPGLMAEAEKASSKFAESGGASERVKAALADAGKALTAFADVAGVPNAGEVDAAQKTIDTALVRMEDKTNEDAVVKDLLTLAKKLGERTGTLAKTQERVAGLLKKVNVTVTDTLKSMTPPGVYQKYDLRLTSAKSLASGQQYDAAETLLKEIKTEADEEVKRYEKDYGVWALLSARIDDWQELIARPDKEKVFVPRELAVKLQLAIGEIKAAALNRDFGEVVAVDKRTNPAQLAADFQNLFEKFKEAATPEGKGGKKSPEAGVLQKAQQEADALLKKAEETIQGAKAAGADHVALTGQLAGIRSEWGRLIVDALKSKEEGAVPNARLALAELLRQFEADVATLLKDKTGKLTASKETRQNRDAFAEIADNLKQLGGDLQGLAAEDPAAAKLFEPRLEELKKILLRDPAVPVPKDQWQAVLKLSGEVDDAFAQLKKEAKGVVGTVAADLKEGKKELEKLKDKHGDFKKYFESMTQRLDSITPMTESDSPGVQKAAAAALEKLRLEIRNDWVEMEYIEGKLESTKKDLERDEVKTCRPSDRKAMLLRRDTEVKEAVRGQPPTPGRKVIDDFAAEVKAVLDDAVVKTKAREDIKKEVKRLEKMLETLKGADTLKKHFKGQLEAAESPNEGEEAKVLMTLSILARKLTDALIDGDKAAVQERQLAARDFAAAKEGKEFEAARQIFEKGLMLRAEQVKKDTPDKKLDPARFEDMQDLLKEARAYGVQGQYLLATEKLKLAESAAREFLDNPMGAKKTARNSLPKVNDDWKRAVSEYLSKLSQMRVTLTSEAGKDEDLKDKVGVIGERLNYAAGLFDSSKFDGPVKTLADDKTELAENRKVKEVGLQAVRLYKATLAAKNPVLEILRKHPTDPLTTDAIAARLDDMEFNLLRA